MRTSREECEHTGSLSCLALCCRCGSNASRLRRFVGPAAVAESITHKVGDDIDVCSINPSAKIHVTSIDWCPPGVREVKVGRELTQSRSLGELRLVCWLE
jgi:hypothetical protein